MFNRQSTLFKLKTFTEACFQMLPFTVTFQVVNNNLRDMLQDVSCVKYI